MRSIRLLVVTIFVLASSSYGSVDTGLFEIGGLIQGSMPSAYAPNLGSGASSGIGAGYGFSAGIRALPYVTIFAGIDGYWNSVDNAATSADEFASNATLGLGAKVFPLGDNGPRFYGLVGIGMATHWIQDHFTVLPEEGTGASYRGTRYSLGAGYEHQIGNHLNLFAEFDMARTSLDRRTIKDQPAIPLVEPESRWAPTVRVGLLVVF